MIIDPRIVAEIVEKVVGPIDPTGDSSFNDARLDSLMRMTEVIDLLLDGVEHVALSYASSSQHSVKKAGKFAQEWLKDVQDNEC